MRLLPSKMHTPTFRMQPAAIRHKQGPRSVSKKVIVWCFRIDPTSGLTSLDRCHVQKRSGKAPWVQRVSDLQVEIVKRPMNSGQNAQDLAKRMPMRGSVFGCMRTATLLSSTDSPLTASPAVVQSSSSASKAPRLQDAHQAPFSLRVKVYSLLAAAEMSLL